MPLLLGLIPIKQIFSKAEFPFPCGLFTPTLNFQMLPEGASTPLLLHHSYLMCETAW